MRQFKVLAALMIIMMVTLACGFSTGGETPTATIEPSPAPTSEPTNPPVPTAPVSTLETVREGTVQIEAQGSFVDPELGAVYNVAGRGTGFIIDPSGIAVTNNHVVTGSALLKVWVNGESQPRNARILGVSECWDLAVIDIDGDGYTPLSFHEGEVNPGLEVYAAGFPLGDPEYTLTKGIVSKANANGESNWASVDGVIEHDARIRGGNSGGPLVDADGRVVGINYAGNDTYDLNYAIRAKDALPVIQKLESGQDYESVGVNGNAVVSEDGSISGIWVSSVKSGSPADKSGIQGGDIITTMEGLVLATDGTMSDYCDILRTRSATDTLSVEVLRFSTQEYLTGQINGTALETSFSFAQTLDSEVDNNTGNYGDYVTVQDDYGAIQVSIPSAWTQVDGSPWYSDNEVIGSSITAAADLDAFNNTYTEPGVFFGVSDKVAELAGYIQLLDAYRSSYQSDCKLEGRYDYADSAFEGAYDVYSNCLGSGNTMVLLSARPIQNKTAFLSTVLINIMSDADLDALDEILATFDLVGSLP